MPKKPVVITTNGLFLVLVVTVQNQQIYVSASVCVALSQFSDPEGQRFESSRSHQEQHLMGCCSFCFAWILWGSKRRDLNSPCPALCVPRGRNAPVGRFEGAAWRIHSGTQKSALQCTFAMRFFYSDFRIILVAYHLPHRCTVLLTAVHFSVDLQWYT